MYYLLTENFKSQEQKLVALACQAIEVQKIFMLGSTLLQQRTESIFLTCAPTRFNATHYYLLVLVDKNTGHSDNYIQDKIENACRHLVAVTVIVLHTPQFNTWLSKGHRFACTVVKVAVLLHDGDNIPLALPATINEDGIKKAGEAYHLQDVDKVNEFIAGAELYRLRQQHKMAAFMLHQAAEHALHIILKKGSGLHVNTHNIDKLIRYCSMVSYKIASVFPRETDTDKKLFSLLQKAYIDTRYKDFCIDSNELETIMARVKTIQSMM